MIFVLKWLDLKILCKINNALSNKMVQLDSIHDDPVVLSSFKYTPMTSVYVERWLSIYKHLLTYKRQSKKSSVKINYQTVIKLI